MIDAISTHIYHNSLILGMVVKRKVRHNALSVVHIGATAGIVSMLLRYLPEYKIKVVALKQNDPFYMSNVHGLDWSARITSKYLWAVVAWLYAQSADLIHRHGVVSDTHRRWFFLRHILRNRPFILHYHGSDVRNNSFILRRPWEQRAQAVLVSTPDLLEQEYAVEPTYLPTMVDTELFTKREVSSNNFGLCCLKATQTIPETLTILKDLGHDDIDWRFVRRTYHRPHPTDTGFAVKCLNIPHATMPRWLSSYEWYADISMADGQLLDARSLTGLQAAAVGCKVLDAHGNVLTDLPEQHRPANVRKQLLSIYHNILGEK